MSDGRGHTMVPVAVRPAAGADAAVEQPMRKVHTPCGGNAPQHEANSCRRYYDKYQKIYYVISCPKHIEEWLQQQAELVMTDSGRRAFKVGDKFGN